MHKCDLSDDRVPIACKMKVYFIVSNKNLAILSYFVNANKIHHVHIF